MPKAPSQVYVCVCVGGGSNVALMGRTVIITIISTKIELIEESYVNSILCTMHTFNQLTQD